MSAGESPDIWRDMTLDLAAPLADSFTYDPDLNVMYVPDVGDTRRIMVFHATSQGAANLHPDSSRERSWRQHARGDGIYCGNTRESVAWSSSQPGRAIETYLTPPLRSAEVHDAMAARSSAATYFGPMIRAQFSMRYGEAMVERQNNSYPSEAKLVLLGLGLVVQARRDVLLTPPVKDPIEPRWLLYRGEEPLEHIARVSTNYRKQSGFGERIQYLRRLFQLTLHG